MEIEGEGKEKEAKLLRAIEENLTADDLAVRDYIFDSFQMNFDRMAETVYQLENKDVGRVEFYLPIVRQGGSNSEEDSFNAGDYIISAKPEDGFKISRQSISPTSAVPIETDIFKLFYKGSEAQEHYIALLSSSSVTTIQDDAFGGSGASLTSATFASGSNIRSFTNSTSFGNLRALYLTDGGGGRYTVWTKQYNTARYWRGITHRA
jgi:hypothetical protein